MSLELRVEQVREEHIEPYVHLSRAEFGKSPAVSQANHLRWKFMDNPQGPSVGIHLYKDGKLVARMVALTRLFLHRGKVFRAAHIVDFLVHPKERGMTPLFHLVSGLKKLSGFDFLLIMAPNPAGAAVWEKFVKMQGYFDLDVAVSPHRPMALLHSAGKIRRMALAPLVDLPWKFFAGAACWLAELPSDVQVDQQWPEASELDNMLSYDWGDRVVGLRTAEYLEWRYRRSPVFHYNAIFLRRKGELCGYLMSRRTAYDGIDCFFVVDAFGLPTISPGSWRFASRKQLALLQAPGPEMSIILGNTEWGSLAAMSRLPFMKVPPRFLPRKTTVYADWVSQPRFEIRKDNFYVALGDGDVI